MYKRFSADVAHALCVVGFAQAPSQMELENWMNGLHSACASSFARQHGKENTLKLLRSEIQKLENSIDLVSRPPARRPTCA